MHLISLLGTKVSISMKSSAPFVFVRVEISSLEFGAIIYLGSMGLGGIPFLIMYLHFLMSCCNQKRKFFLLVLFFLDFSSPPSSSSSSIASNNEVSCGLNSFSKFFGSAAS